MSFKLIFFPCFLQLVMEDRLPKEKITVSHTSSTLFYFVITVWKVSPTVPWTPKAWEHYRACREKAILSQGSHMGKFGSIPRPVIVSDPDYREDRWLPTFPQIQHRITDIALLLRNIFTLCICRTSNKCAVNFIKWDALKFVLFYQVWFS